MTPRTHYYFTALAASALALDVYVTNVCGFFCGTMLALVVVTHLSELLFGRRSRLKGMAFSFFLLATSTRFIFPTTTATYSSVSTTSTLVSLGLVVTFGLLFLPVRQEVQFVDSEGEFGL